MRFQNRPDEKLAKIVGRVAEEWIKSSFFPLLFAGAILFAEDILCFSFLLSYSGHFHFEI